MQFRFEIVQYLDLKLYWQKRTPEAKNISRSVAYFLVLSKQQKKTKQKKHYKCSGKNTPEF